ncbi:MAG: rhodanese-like domain-containing protein [Desulfovibrionaceae bacterium]|nr:rhodanese-like domain-containing protein [Desulfovibrionaceae bacterium]
MHKKMIAAAVMLAFALMAFAGPVAAEESKTPAFRQFHTIVDYAFVAKYAKMPKQKDVMIIDSRPYKPKYVDGYIPTAVSIPASQFEKMADQLPKEKDALLIFYCGGLACPLSHKSAFMAEEMGYTNVKVYAEGYPDFKKRHAYASIGLEKLHSMLAEGEQYMLIDSRPYQKFLEGAIPSAIGIPETQFAAKRGMLPADKAGTTLVFYCGGYKCALSHKSAVMARALGYKQVMVAEAGYPGWKEMFGASGTAVQAGEAEGAVDTDWFLKTIVENPSAITLIDVRDPEEFAMGHFPSATNMTVNMIDKNAADIPTDKPIVFTCSTGARAGEAYYLYMDKFSDAKDVFYLEATIDFNEDNTYEVHPNK